VSSSSYEYSIDNGISFQTNPFFEDLEPGNYTVVVRDIITGCFSQSLEVALNQPNNEAVPVFNFGETIVICFNQPVPSLPTSDNNGITGNWNPTTIDNTQSGNYTFTPDENQCATTFILTVTVNNFPTPVFDFGNNLTICSGDEIPVLPAEDNNGVNGFWEPATIDNEVGNTYTFIVNNSECASNFILTVIVNELVTPVFNFGNAITICSGETVPNLPTTDNNGVNGIWTPASIDNTQTANYTFEPTDACVESFTLTVTVSTQVTPVFSFGNQLTICSGETVPSLPTLDNNGMNGVWTPASIDNTKPANYTFEPSDDCAESFILNVIVNDPITPVFSLPSSICFNSNAETLPTESENGIIGTWNPSTINSTNDTLYTFTPASTSCATGFSTTIAVLPTFSIEIFDQCENNQFTIGVELNDNSNVILTDYSWINENGTVVGTNSSTFNITEYIRSTPQTETFPLFFTVRATSIDGCFAEENISIPTIFCGIQKGISPNGDNLNDFFDLALLDVEKLSIFNRYGRKVYTQNNYTNQWFGQTDDGKELPSATYYYFIEFRNGESKSGWIYIMREESR
jgi:gliding motility-associated-like protein